MKKIVLTFTLFFQLAIIFCQENEKFVIIKNTKNWSKEIIKFPIDWVPELAVKGFEELLFSPKWKDKKNDEFWSLVMSWNIKSKSRFSKKKIAYYFKSYFDGLMEPNHWAKEFPKPKVTFKRSSKRKLSGNMTFFDGFHTGKILTVNIEVEQYLCKKSNNVFIIFRISPKAKNHSIWKNLHQLKLRTNFCK